MFSLLKAVVGNVFTARNNLDYSLTKLLGIVAGGEMIYKFAMMDKIVAADIQSFGIGIAAVMAALAAKYYVEGEQGATTPLYAMPPYGMPTMPIANDSPKDPE